MSRPRLLIIEDDAALRDFYRMVLDAHGYDVKLCEDGLDAIYQMHHRRPDLIVLDLDLPRMSGVAFYERLQSQPTTRDIPVLVVTGLTDPHPVSARVLRKPVHVDDLCTAIEQALQKGGG